MFTNIFVNLNIKLMLYEYIFMEETDRENKAQI